MLRTVVDLTLFQVISDKHLVIKVNLFLSRKYVSFSVSNKYIASKYWNSLIRHPQYIVSNDAKFAVLYKGCLQHVCSLQRKRDN